MAAPKPQTPSLIALLFLALPLPALALTPSEVFEQVKNSV